MSSQTESASEREQLCQELLYHELARRRAAIDTAFRDVEDILLERPEDDLTAEDVLEMRRALNHARRIVEDYATRAVDGVEPWGEPRPEMPYGVYRDVLES